MSQPLSHSQFWDRGAMDSTYPNDRGIRELGPASPRVVLQLASFCQASLHAFAIARFWVTR
jgi:hypothetical protein